MTSARRRLRATRALLASGVAARALLWAATAAIAVLLAVGGDAAWGFAAAVTAAAVTAAALTWRGRAVGSAEAVALWIEERNPALGYALVTLADPRFSGEAAPLERVIARLDWSACVRRALLRALLPAAVALAAAAALLLMAPHRTAEGMPRLPLVAPRGLPPAGAGSSALGPLRVRVDPPAYTGERSTELVDPASVAAIVGSRLSISGPDDPGGLTASIDERSLGVAAGERGWRLELSMPPRPAAVRLGGGSEQRLLVLEPLPDSLPVVTLLAPATDTVFRVPAGRIEVHARARDDWGLEALRLEYIVSSGEGEIFEFRSGVLDSVAPGGHRDAMLDASLALDALGVRHGDVVHLRAVARDRNDVTGPGIGVSETRALRVARTGEYDSVAVEAAPPPEAERALLSQRMLIQLTEALQARRSRLAREAVTAESRRIAVDQVRLRRQVGDVVFMRLGEGEGAEHAHGGEGHVHYHGDGHDHEGEELPTAEELLRRARAATGGSIAELTHSHGDESPVLALNRPLLEAYNAMWSAAGELEIGEPAAALPHMYTALRAIQRAREAERLYLRGGMPLVIVDLARVRLTGRIDGAEPSARAPLAAVDATVERRIARFEAGVALLGSEPAAAVDSLLLLRVELLQDAPAAAAALGHAIDDLRRGREATDGLVRTRRALAGAPKPRSGLARWGGGWGVNDE